MVTVIIASYKEKKSIGKAIRGLFDSLGAVEINEFEIIQVSPDTETLTAGKQMAKKLGISDQYTQIVDPGKGKSFALNLALDTAHGDIIVMSDGDVVVDRNSIKYLLEPLLADKKIAGSTGKPVPNNEKRNFMGYLAHLLTSAADHKRKSVFTDISGEFFRKDGGYFPLSGYLLAFKNLGFRYNPAYIDDTFITLQIIKEGHQLAYTPKAEVYVNFPTTLKDYLKQRRRNIRGTKKIHEDKSFGLIEDQRSLSKELKYMLYPLRYASGPRELLYSLLLYPLRILTWIYALIPQRNKEYESWDRIESTKER